MKKKEMTRLITRSIYSKLKLNLSRPTPFPSIQTRAYHPPGFPVHQPAGTTGKRPTVGHCSLPHPCLTPHFSLPPVPSPGSADWAGRSADWGGEGRGGERTAGRQEGSERLTSAYSRRRRQYIVVVTAAGCHTGGTDLDACHAERRRPRRSGSPRATNDQENGII